MTQSAAVKVLIVSASMGAGHDGAARELQRRLQAQGHEATVEDFLAAFPLRTGGLVRWGYEMQLRTAPWAYEATYRMWYRVPGAQRPLVWLVAALTHRRIRGWLRETSPDVVVSTYPLSSLVLGRDRLRRELTVPVATFITDFAVHPLWTHRGVDEHICVHPQSAETAARQAGGRAVAPGPLIPRTFRAECPPRAEARRQLGFSEGERLVLLVAGSWGVGEIEETFDDVVATERYTPIVVCGRNDRLRRKLADKGVGHVMGWTDQMPALMGASDVLVQNAGGLTCMEAFAAGLPVVSYRPIAGHGKENAADMERAGVAAYAREPSELEAVLDQATGPRRAELVDAARAMFSGDAADDVVELTGQVVPLERPVTYKVRHLVAQAAMLVLVAYAIFTAGVGLATSNGIGVAHASGGKGTDTAYLAVRVGPKSVTDPDLPAALADAHVTAVVDGSLAEAQPEAVRRFREAGVNVANGGWGEGTRFVWRRAHADLRRSGVALKEALGEPVEDFVTSRRLNGFDLTWARLAHERVVVPSHWSSKGIPAEPKAGAIYVVDAREAGADDTLAMISDAGARLTARGLHAAPLSQLH